MRVAQENTGDLTCDCGPWQRLQPELAQPHPGMVEKPFAWGRGGAPQKTSVGGWKKGLFQLTYRKLAFFLFRTQQKRKAVNHPEERLLDQAQARASYTPFFGGGHLRSIPVGMIFDIQPFVK